MARKMMRFRKSLGRRKKAYGSTKRRYSYGHKRTYKRKYNPYRKWKKSYRSKRFFRAGAPALSGAQKSILPKIPKKLFVYKAIASSVLTSIKEYSSDFFVNSPTFLSKDLAKIPDYYSNRDHLDALLSLNPSNIFLKDAENYGIDSSTVDPLIRVKRTKLHFSGHNQDLVTVLSFFSPLSLSYSSCVYLNQLIGCKFGFLARFLKYFAYMPAVVYSEDTVNNLLEYQIGTWDFFLRPWDHARNPEAENNPNAYKKENIFRYDKVSAVLANRLNLNIFFQHCLTRLCLKASSTFSFDELLYIDITNDTITFKPFTLPPEAIVSSAAIQQAITARIRVDFPDRNLAEAGGVFLHLKFVFDTYRTANFFKKAFYCLSTCDQTITQAFVAFVADMLGYSTDLLLRGKPIGEHSSFVGAYSSELLYRNNLSEIDYNNFLTLVEQKVVRLKKISTRRSVSYYPKSQVNAHWVIANPGISVKISTVFSRDYSGFMSLFKESVKNNALRKELNAAGLNLFRRLEPAYNLYT